MQKLKFSVFINAPREKVWDIMLSDETYREWTSIFSEGSYFEGSWTEGSTMRFLGPTENGSVMGMLARIKEARHPEFISIEHLGEISGGEEKLWSEEEKEGGIFENYTFTEKDGGTELIVDLDSADKYADMFNDMWPRALQKLKEIIEK